jgi:membrane protein implicated in regulation of membrane protease activity
MRALAERAVGNPSGRGEVRFQKPLMGADTWPCLADEAITAGTRVKVLGVDGQFLKVGRAAAVAVSAVAGAAGAANPNADKR